MCKLPLTNSMHKQVIVNRLSLYYASHIHIKMLSVLKQTGYTETETACLFRPTVRYYEPDITYRQL
jgi:hypothetical protein